MGDFMAQMAQNPEMMEAMKDPEVMMAFMDIQQNPANITKHMGNPKLMAILSKLMGGMGGGGMPDMSGMGGMPGMPDMSGFGGGGGADVVDDDEMPDLEPEPEATNAPTSVDEID